MSSLRIPPEWLIKADKSLRWQEEALRRDCQLRLQEKLPITRTLANLRRLRAVLVEEVEWAPAAVHPPENGSGLLTGMRRAAEEEEKIVVDPG